MRQYMRSCKERREAILVKQRLVGDSQRRLAFVIDWLMATIEGGGTHRAGYDSVSGSGTAEGCARWGCEVAPPEQAGRAHAQENSCMAWCFIRIFCL